MDHRFLGPKTKNFALSAAHFLSATGGKKQRPQKRALLSLDPILTTFLRQHPLCEEYKKDILVQGSFGMGPASMAFQVEILAAQGIEKIVTLGTAGALGAALDIAAPVMIERALIDEGVSPQYGSNPGEWSPADTGLVKQFSAQLLPVSSWTTETPLRESSAEISHYVELGIQAVEMEASALYSVARELGVKALAVVVISDRVLPGQWEPHLQDPKVRTTLERSTEQVLRLLGVS